MPLIESEVALATDQESVALSPASKGEIDAGEAVKEEIVGTVALPPVNGTSSACPGISGIARIDCDPKVVALAGAAPPKGEMRLFSADDEVTVIFAEARVALFEFNSVAL